MALINCPDCNNPVSDSAVQCPKCGYPIKDIPKLSVPAQSLESPKTKEQTKTKANPPKSNNGCAVVLIVVVLILFFGFLAKQCSGPEDTSVSATDSEMGRSKEDSIQNQASLDSINKQVKIEEEKFLKTKAGKIYKKHPEWSKEDCISLADRKVWVGMQYEMVVYLRGRPNDINTSNYGSGPSYQACWYDYDPSCFYFGEDHIITAYN